MRSLCTSIALAASLLGLPSNAQIEGTGDDLTSTPLKAGVSYTTNRAVAPRLRVLRPVAAMPDSARATAQVEMSAPRTATYIWDNSRYGGYYDRTGQIKEVVPADKLYLYGGTFNDGSLVPQGPCWMNAGKHTIHNANGYTRFGW